MNNLKTYINKVPGWVYTIAVFGFLYLTGLHTEAIGQVQRALLATGLVQPTIPEATTGAVTLANPSETASSVYANDFTLQDMEGNQIQFSSLKGKVVFLNIWATWCPPCIAEMPSIQKLYDRMKHNPDVAFVMLSVDQAGMKKVKPFINKKGYTFPVYIPANGLPQAFQTQSIPTTFFTGKTGKIEMRHEGMADYSSKGVEEFLVKLSKE